MPNNTVTAFGWDQCARLANAQTELLVSLDVGPRILSYKTEGSANALGHLPEELGASGEPEFRVRGGHRLWVAPETEISYAPDNGPVNFEFRDDMGGTPAYAVGNKIALSAPWFPGQLKNEAKGCVVHEMGHVVQNYWRAGQTNPTPSPTPGWVTEGICDYIRWFLFEPESKGAVIRDARQAKHDASYRVTGNFLDWLTTAKDKDLVRKLNAAAREGRYDEKLWKEWTGKTVQELGEEWSQAIADGNR